MSDLSETARVKYSLWYYELEATYASNLLDWGTNLTKLLITYRDACKT